MPRELRRMGVNDAVVIVAGSADGKMEEGTFLLQKWSKRYS